MASSRPNRWPACRCGSQPHADQRRNNHAAVCTAMRDSPAMAGQRGAAVIMVLLIVALATTLAAYMALQQDLWQRQMENQFNWNQARKIGIAGTDWARAVLADDASNNNYD